MMSMGGDLRQLHIVPLAISYEYDPCDYLKAEEFQHKRDIPGFKKSQADDLNNMRTGIFGYKGHIHYQSATCINAWLDTLPSDLPKSEYFRKVASHIDEEQQFSDYLSGQLSKISIEDPDWDYLRRCILTMYANPAANYLKAIS